MVCVVEDLVVRDEGVANVGLEHLRLARVPLVSGLSCCTTSRLRLQTIQLLPVAQRSGEEKEKKNEQRKMYYPAK